MMKMKMNVILNFVIVLHALILCKNLCRCYYNYYKKPIDLRAFFEKNTTDLRFENSVKTSNRLKKQKNNANFRMRNSTNNTVPLINQIGNLFVEDYSPNIGSVLKKKQDDDEKRVGYWITNIDYTIKVKNHTCDAVYEIDVSYLFQKGEFSSFMIKASIDGTVDENVGIQVNSVTSGIQITETKVVLNCIDPDQQTDNPYVCIVVILHRPINARLNSVSARFNLEYYALGFLRRDPGTLNNYFILNIDNQRRAKSMNNVSVTLNIHTSLPIANFLARPSSFVEMKNGNKLEYNSYYWHFQEVPGLAIQPIVGMFPEAYKVVKCRQINDINYLGNNKFVFVQYLTWTTMIGFFGYLVVFISVNEREKYFIYKNSEDFQEDLMNRERTKFLKE